MKNPSMLWFRLWMLHVSIIEPIINVTDPLFHIFMMVYSNLDGVPYLND